jgi:hypothetical protein
MANKTIRKIKDRHRDKSFDFLSHSHTDTNDENRNRPAEDWVENMFRKKKLVRAE